MNSRVTSFLALYLGLGGQALSWYWLRQPYLLQDFGWHLGFGLNVVSSAMVFYCALRPIGWRGAWLLSFSVFIMDWAFVLASEYIEAVFQPSFSGVAWLASLLLSGSGASSTYADGVIHVNGLGGYFAFASSMGLLGMGTAALLAMKFAFFAYFLRFPKWVNQVAWATVVLVALFVARYALTILRYTNWPDAMSEKSPSLLHLFWSGWSLAILVFVWALMVSQFKVTMISWRNFKPLKLGHLFLGTASGVLVTIVFVWGGFPNAKSGRVLIDDRLSGVWEPAGRLLTTDRFGDFSAYSFSALTEGLSHRFSVNVNGKQRYTEELLSNYDVFVIKTPETPLSEAEQDVIRLWVKEGGGLYVIGDHTDLLGMSTHINELIDGSGIRFSFDATGTTASGGFDYWAPPIISEHPISRGLPKMEFMTPCSLNLSNGATPVMTVRQSASSRGDYSMNSNFGAMAASPADYHGLLVVAATAGFGKGRIAAFSDSTVFSSFAIGSWGHQDLFYRTVAWLNQEEKAILSLMARLLAALGLGAILYSVWRGSGNAPGLFVGVIPGVMFGFWSIGVVEGTTLSVPSVSTAVVRTAFVSDGVHAWFPAVLGSQPDLPETGNFATLSQVPLRLGHEVEIAKSVDLQLEGVDQLVLLNPEIGDNISQEGMETWVPQVRSWVREGGSLVVFSRANHLGHPHDLASQYFEGVALHEANNAGAIAQVFHGKLGDGSVVHVIGSEKFDSAGMGHCMEYPNEKQFDAYKLAFEVFGGLSGVNVPDRKTYIILD